MINDASVVIGGGNWGIKEADVLGYKLINDEYYARDIDFANSTAAGTYTDSTGVVRKAPYNLLQQSNTFNVTWGTAFATVTIGQPGYDGTNNAWLFSKSLADGRISQPITLTSGAYTYSVYAKAGTKNWVFLRTDGTSNRTAYFDLQTGVTGTATGCTSSISPVGNGWYRCSITFTDSMTIARIYVADANNDTSGTSGNILIQAAQLVEGTEALPYFPTPTRLNVPRIAYRNADGSLSTVGRLLLEPQRTNSIRNSSMVGAVVGSFGTLPTNWAVTNLSGLTQTIVGTGIENGLPYFDIRYNGTATSTSSIDVRDEATTQIAAANGQSWTHTAYLRLVSAVVPPASVQVGIYERTSAGIFVVGGFATAAITSTLQRFSINRTLSGGATVAFTQPLIQFSVNNATAYDFTIRIAAPQMELGAYATTWIPTTTAAVTRNADSASKTGVSSWIGQTEGTLFLDFEGGPNDSIDYVYGINDGTTSNRIIIYRSSSNTIITQVRVSGGSQALIQTATVTPNTRQKCAVAYKLNDIAFYVNGVQIGVDTSSTIPACSVLATNDGAGAGLFGRPINQSALFPTRLTNSQLQSLTTI